MFTKIGYLKVLSESKYCKYRLKTNGWKWIVKGIQNHLKVADFPYVNKSSYDRGASWLAMAF